MGRGRLRSVLRSSISSLDMEKVNGARPSTLCGAWENLLMVGVDT